MAKGSVITITTGAPGTGKSYTRCARFLYDEFLPETKAIQHKKTKIKIKAGVHYSNFPIVLSELSRSVSLKLKCSEQDVIDRIHVIPETELIRWRKEETGPWEYFSNYDLTGSHIALDEIHELVKPESSKEYRSKWEDWLATIRHERCTIEFLTQDLSSVITEIKNRCSIRLELVDASTERDPFFHILMGDWYELQASYTKLYIPAVWEKEYKRSFGRWKLNRVRKFRIDKYYFKFYNSFSKGIIHNSKRDQNIKLPDDIHEFEKRTFLSLQFWFFQRNFFSLFSRFAIFIVFVYFCFGGGAGVLIRMFMNTTKQALKSNISNVSTTQNSNVFQEKKVVQKNNNISNNISTSDISDTQKNNNEIRIVLITPSSAITNTNQKLYIGYKFKDLNVSVEKIMFYERQVLLSNGVVLTF